MPFKSTKKSDKKTLLGELKVTQRLSDYEFGVELWVMREGLNRNKWDYRNLEQHYLSFMGRPILVAYVNAGTKVGDGHNMTERTDPRTGEKYYSFTDGTAERIVGTLSDESEDFSIRERDGRKWLVAKGRLFAFYAKELVDQIVRIGRMEVSAETEVTASYKDGDVEVFTDWTGLGVTVLGEGVAPAIPGAKIYELAAIQEDFKELKLKAAAFNGGSSAGKPQKNNNQKGMNTLNVFSKRELAEVAKRFEGYTVLSAAKDDEGVIYVCLMDKDGNTAGYQIKDMNETIVPEKIAKMSVKAAFNFGENKEICVDAYELVDDISAKLVKANSALEKANGELENEKNTVKAMKEAEDKRRVLAAKEVAKETLKSFNANRNEKVSETILDSVNAKIDEGVFTNSVNAEGLWNGDEAVRKEVKALCADEVMAMDEKAVAKNQTVNVLDKLVKNSGQSEGVRGLLDRLGIE